MANQLLLIKDVASLGRSGEVVNVKPGYARNFLLPQGLAIIATKQTLRMQERLQKERRERAIIEKKEAEAVASALTGVAVSTVVKVDHEGHMYGSVSAHDIVHLLLAQANITIEKSDVALKHPIKKLGSHEIHLKLKEGVTTSVMLEVIPEDPKFLIPKEPVEEAKAPEEKAE